jgi:hypothetical protein
VSFSELLERGTHREVLNDLDRNPIMVLLETNGEPATAENVVGEVKQLLSSQNYRHFNSIVKIHLKTKKQQSISGKFTLRELMDLYGWVSGKPIDTMVDIVIRLEEDLTAAEDTVETEFSASLVDVSKIPFLL